MCSFVILFLLFFNGGCMQCCGTEHTGRCRHGVEPRRENEGCGCREKREIQSRNTSDCGCDERREAVTPPPWVKSNYANGDTCGCEEQ